MIVVDGSALIAILFDAPEKQMFEDILAGGERCIMSAVNAHETACVLSRRNGQLAITRLWQLLTDCEIEIIPFDKEQMRAGSAAFDSYGKGIDPKARLNLSDCAAYALAKSMDAPLLFKGDDFSQTDVKSCLSNSDR